MKFPKFDKYACVGDSILWEKDGFEIRATIEPDDYSNVADFDCYSASDIKRWKNNEWFFCGIVLSISYNGITLEDHAASLWSIECNIRKRGNSYLSEVAKELESEALEAGRAARARMLEKLEH